MSTRWGIASGDRCSPSTYPTPPRQQVEVPPTELGRAPTRAWLLAAVQQGGSLLCARVGQLADCLKTRCCKARSSCRVRAARTSYMEDMTWSAAT